MFSMTLAASATSMDECLMGARRNDAAIELDQWASAASGVDPLVTLVIDGKRGAPYHPD